LVIDAIAETGGVTAGMDDIDMKLLDVIQKNGRGAYACFGRTVGLSTTAIHERLKKLTARGIIKGWGAFIDPVKAGFPVIAFVRIEIDLPTNREVFADSVSALPNVQECHLTSGRWSCCLKLRAPSIEEAERIINEEITPMKGVVGLQVEVVTRTSKETPFVPQH